MSSESALRRAIRASMNRHWYARLVIAAWVIHIPLVAFLAPDSLVGRALERSGPMGVVMLLLLLVFAGAALVDSAINDVLPERFTSALMHHRHVGFMLMAVDLVVLGGAVAVLTGTPVALASFLLPALFAVGVTWLDLYARHRSRLS